jgi:hypothetical protein
MMEISDRLTSDRADQACDLTAELRNEKSTVSLVARLYTLDASRSLSKSKYRVDVVIVAIEARSFVWMEMALLMFLGPEPCCTGS